MKRTLLLAAAYLAAAAPVHADAIRLANNPALSPDASMIAFDWNGDIWTAPTSGGVAKQLTQNPARDRQPKFSPDGKTLAFISDRDGAGQAYVIPAEGGVPTQLTFHTAGCSLQEWTPDGKRLLLSGSRDYAWRRGERFFTVSATERSPEVLIFDEYGANGSISPNGNKLLFTREGAQWWRKGYHGSQASQVWVFDEATKKFESILTQDRGSLWPMWRPDGNGCFYVGGQTGNFNLYEYDAASKESRPLTKFPDDSVVFPCISRDGTTIVFRHLFDLYRLRLGSSEGPQKIAIDCAADRVPEKVERRVLTTASQVAFSNDGLELALIAGGDLWVMDTELKEPRRVTTSAEEETSPVFAPEGDSVLFISNAGGKCDIVRMEKGDKSKPWFLNTKFPLTPLTEDGATKTRLTWSPAGNQVAYLKDRGELWVMEPSGKNPKMLVKSFSAVEYDWSPDGKWMVASYEDEDFNRDIYILPLDGSKPPANVSRTPSNERNPTWSPDGKLIAFTGKNGASETDLYYVWLRAEDDETSSRERTLEKAIEKINKARSGVGSRRPERSPETPADPSAPAPPTPPAPGRNAKRPDVTIDFDKLHERVKLISIPDSTENDLFWSADSKQLLFTATLDGRRGTCSVSFPDDLRAKSFMTAIVSQPRWLRTGNQIVGLVAGVPTAVTISASGRPTSGAPATASAAPGGGRGGRGGAPGATLAPAAAEGESAGGTGYRFQALQMVDLPKKHAAVFALCWRTMRDQFYDERLGNRNWDDVFKKYTEMSAAAPDQESLVTVIQLMLGELNGSHLGFSPSSGAAAGAPPRRGRGGPTPDEPTAGATWRESTAHLGVRFDMSFAGPGLKVRDVIPDGPADHKKTALAAGEIVLAIDGAPVDKSMDLTKVLNGPPSRDVTLKVKAADGKERDVVLRPTTYGAIRSLLYDKWLDDNRKAVDVASKGKLGYIHIDAMSMPSFWKFEKELYAAGAGKDGLIIDVRENGGGSTTDHLLTALTQPVHAITVPRGGTPGYPHDRKVYASWSKPIVVMCNQNSFSNAEIFSHAIKSLNRGQLVGVPTAGGVISTGSAQIMDVGTLRLPGRGWYVATTGDDMELNGAVPHHVVWPEPGQAKDMQIEKAVEVLLADVQTYKSRPQPPLRKATERK